VRAIQLFLQSRIKFLKKCSPRNTSALHDIYTVTVDGDILRLGQYECKRYCVVGDNTNVRDIVWSVAKFWRASFFNSKHMELTLGMHFGQPSRIDLLLVRFSCAIMRVG
jgi:hypothetical protein